MQDIKMEVYTPGLELLGILEEFSGFQYEECAFSAGSFLVDAPLTDSTRALLVSENIIWFTGDVAGIIESLEEQAGQDGDSLIARGRLLTGLLDRRILWGRYDLYGKPATLMRNLVNDCAIAPTRGDVENRKIPNLILGQAPTETVSSVRKQKTGGTLLETLEAMGEAHNVAFGVGFDAAALKMPFFTRPCADRTINQTENEPVFFSTELDDVFQSEYSYNSAPYKNVALVAGEGEGADRMFVTVTGEFEEGPITAVDFVPSGETAALRTADGKRFTVRAVSTETDPYTSAYTGQQIDQAIGDMLNGGGGTQGPQGPKGDKGDPGEQGPAGPGVPTGGTAGQILAKNTNADYDTHWIDPPESGGTTTGVTSFNGRTGAVMPQTGDYTAAMVGAATPAQVTTAIQAAVLDSWEGTY